MTTRTQRRVSDVSSWIGLRASFVRSSVPQSSHLQRLDIRLRMLVEGLAVAGKEESMEAEVMTAVDSARARAVEEGLAALAVVKAEKMAVPVERVGLAGVGAAGAAAKDSQAETEEQVAALEPRLPERKPPRVALIRSEGAYYSGWVD